jgi:hypothetical protein
MLSRLYTDGSRLLGVIGASSVIFMLAFSTFVQQALSVELRETIIPGTVPTVGRALQYKPAPKISSDWVSNCDNDDPNRSNLPTRKSLSLSVTLLTNFY